MGFPEFDFPDPLTVPASGPNLLRTGLTWLTQQLKAQVSEAIVYARGYDSVECRATLGKKLLKLDDGAGGFRIEWTDMDFLVPAADMTFDGGMTRVVPERADLIFLSLTGDDDVQVFEVTAYGSDPPWRWSDPFGQMRRIHGKHIDSEPYS